MDDDFDQGDRIVRKSYKKNSDKIVTKSDRGFLMVALSSKYIGTILQVRQKRKKIIKLIPIKCM